MATIDIKQPTGALRADPMAVPPAFSHTTHATPLLFLIKHTLCQSGDTAQTAGFNEAGYSREENRCFSFVAGVGDPGCSTVSFMESLQNLSQNRAA